MNSNEPRPPSSSSHRAASSTPRRHGSRSTRAKGRDEAARTSNACYACREKKVKCSGQQPCGFCQRRGLDCMFAATEKRQMVSIDEIRQLREKVAFYEHQHHGAPPSPSSSAAVGNPTPRMDSDRVTGEPASDSPSIQTAAAVAPEMALSSSDTFSSELKTLLLTRSGITASLPASVSPILAPLVDGSALLNGPSLPSDDDAHAMLEIVVQNVGVSQHMFDTRAFSDNLSLLQPLPSTQVPLPELWIAEMWLVFAIGRLLQAQPDDDGGLPGTLYFQEAIKRTPALTELRKHGVLGIEVVGLAAMYLQIVDRKEDAYLYANTALRLAVTHGLHRAGPTTSRQRSQAVHQNRLFWSLYMQERRLCAACGYPMSLGDYTVTASPPYDAIGYPPATALSINVRTARITGQITSTIYMHKDEGEESFLANVRKILRTLSDIEKQMPPELHMDLDSSGIRVAGMRFQDCNPSTARTSSSLYISVYAAVIHAVRPILLHMVRSQRDPSTEHTQTEVSPALRRLAEIGVEAASKSLAILQELQRQEILAKHAFLDLDATFSVGFVFVLVEAINPGAGLGFDGIEGARTILAYLVNLGNQAAAKRLEDLTQMCRGLSLPVRQQVTTTPLQQGTQSETSTNVLTQPFSFSDGHVLPNSSLQQADETVSSASTTGFQNRTDQPQDSALDFNDPSSLFNGADLASIPLDGDEGLYWIYHNPDLLLTGVEQIDWETLESIT